MYGCFWCAVHLPEEPHQVRRPCDALEYFDRPSLAVQPAAATPLQGHRSLPTATLARRPWAVVSKMAADQLFMAPLGTACFFAWTKATEGKADEAVPFIKVGLPFFLYLPVVLVYASSKKLAARFCCRHGWTCWTGSLPQQHGRAKTLHWACRPSCSTPFRRAGSCGCLRTL